MNITVNEQEQRFYLAAKKWEPVVGHEIKIGEYRFCAIPTEDGINVSEVSSGAKVTVFPMNLKNSLLAQTKKDSMKIFNKIGESIKRIIEKQSDFDAQLEKLKQTAFDRLGKMPPIVDVDVKAEG